MRKYLTLENLVRIGFYFYIFFGFFAAFIYLLVWFASSFSSLTLNQYIVDYSAGFIRRGLLGTLISFLSLLTHIHERIFIIFFLIFAYAVFLYYTIKIIKMQNTLIPFAFLIFSNIIFNYFFESGFGRSEVFYYPILAFVVAGVKEINFLKFWRKFIISQVYFIFLLFIHEAFIFFYPYLIAVFFVYIYRNFNEEFTKVFQNYKNQLLIIIFLIFVTISVEIFLLFKGIPDKNKLQMMILNLILRNQWFSFNDFYFLNLKLVEHMQEIVLPEVLNMKTILIYSVLTIIIISGFYPLKSKIKIIYNYKLVLICIFFCMIGTIILSLIALDIGRWIHINIFSIFFLILSFPDEVRTVPINKKNLFLYAILFIFYISTWHLPMCCVSSFSYKDIFIKNPVNLFMFHYKMMRQLTMDKLRFIIQNFFIDPGIINKDIQLPDKTFITALSFHHEQQILAYSHFDGTIILWDMERKTIIREFNPFKRPIRFIQFSNDGQFILLCVDTCKSSETLIMNLETNQYKQISDINSFDFIPFEIYAYYLKINKDLYDFKKEISTLKVLRNKNFIIISLFPEDLILYDIKERKDVVYFRGHIYKITGIDVSPDEKYMISAGWDGLLCKWNLFSGEKIKCWNANFPLNAVSYLSDGKRLAFAGMNNKIVIIDSELSKVLDIIHLDQHLEP